MPKGIKGFQKGNKVNLGKKLSEEHKRKISESGKRSQNSGRFKKGHKIHLGKKVSKEIKEKIRKKLTGFKHSDEAKKNMGESHKGDKHWNWKGGISPETEKIRHSLESKLWQDSVKNRDGNCCQKCGERRIGKLTAHHIQNFAQYPELRFALDNGITFCRVCHKKFHKRFGFKNNTREQLNEFLCYKKN